MATAASAMQPSLASTAAPRRKRVATYGKSRNKTFAFNDDVISPEKPRTKAGATSSGSWGPTGLKNVSKLGFGDKGSDAQKTGGDVFDVPSSSEDELSQPSPKKAFAKPVVASRPAKLKYTAGTGQKSRDAPNGDDVVVGMPLSSEDERKKPVSRNAPVETFTTSRSAKLGKGIESTEEKQPAQPMLTKAARIFGAAGGKSLAKPKLGNPAEISSKAHSAVPKRTEGNSRDASKKPEYDILDLPSSNEDILTKSPVTTPKKPSPLTKRPEKKGPVIAKKAEYDMFDVPSTDDDKPPQRQTSLKSRPKQVPTLKSIVPSKATNTVPSPKQLTESDSSTTAKKRKRYIPTSSAGSQGFTNQENAYKDTVPVEHQRSAKHMRRDASASRDVKKKIQFAEDGISAPRPNKAEVIHKPQRTRTRTVPVTAPLSKGQSAPAKLHNMLAVRESRPVRYPSPIPSIPSSPQEDYAMENTEYSEMLPSTPPPRQSALPRSPMRSGAVTPRQRQAWSKLLGDDTVTPGMLKLEDLRISSERRESKMAAKLGRSSSDIPHTMHTKRPRLIDSLKKSAPPSDDEDDGTEEEEEEEEVESKVVDAPQGLPTRTEKRTYGRVERTLLAAPQDVGNITEDMDIDIDAAEASQSSQSAPILADGPKRTYAKQRSYLNEANLEAELLFSLPMESPAPAAQRRGLNAKPQSGLAKLDDDEDDDQPTNTVRSIHELRKGGEILRFRTDIEALLDDINDTTSYGRARRRSAMLELATKLSDAAIVHRVIELGLDRQLFSRLSSSEDPIFNFTAAATTAFVIKAGVAPGVLEHIYNTGAATCFASLLERDTDILRIAKERKSNLSKLAQKDVIEFRKVVHDSALWKDDRPGLISPQLVALRGLDLLVRGLRKVGSKDDLQDDQVVSKLLEIADTHVEDLKSDQMQAPDFKTLKLCLSITESLSLSGVKVGVWSSKSLKRVASMMPFFIDTLGTESTDTALEMKATLDRLAIRLVINLTNNNVRACEIFSTSALVLPLCRSIDRFFNILDEDQIDEESRETILESLYLSLGAMINLAEFSDAARGAVCEKKASEGDVMLERLVIHFLSGTERAAEADSLEASRSNVAYGYLTVLLGNLCQNTDVKRKVVRKLPNQKIDILVNAVTEFIEYNLRVDQEVRMLEGDEGREVWSGFTERLGKVVQRLVAV
ncbi:uncharacterized protein BDZ99DRAFT_201368 [Mytilinidion resinicola]|uniref:Wings apart-like protein C-terminal domain-containing protein n=1 Tax=Mytilinidion resinicola TaxID=574789 RepID=A0A6A6Y1V7_9PEZI|nr:uncharacterized protein BDZ99DRAFT_201368 [Mytilinidion resinicola]KAF2802640.1 hypothetical protein BDZ99DRAFT_201368 [Mytilinidion resinicola]